MQLAKNEVKSLINMGLSPNQAKVYLSLVHSGMSTTKTISQVSGIAQHDIYRTISTLIRMGFVDETLKRPAIFKAIPLKDAIYILLKQKKHEVTIIETEARNTLSQTMEQLKKIPNIIIASKAIGDSEGIAVLLFKNSEDLYKKILQIKKFPSISNVEISFAIPGMQYFPPQSIPSDLLIMTTIKQNQFIQ